MSVREINTRSLDKCTVCLTTYVVTFATVPVRCTTTTRSGVATTGNMYVFLTESTTLFYQPLHKILYLMIIIVHCFDANKNSLLTCFMYICVVKYI